MNKHYLSSLLAVFLLALIAYLGSSIGLQWLFGIVLPYLAVVIFIVGVVRRVLGWSSSAVPFRITTTCGQQKSMPWVKQATIDNPSTGLGVFIRMALEILTFRSLFRNTRITFSCAGCSSQRPLHLPGRGLFPLFLIMGIALHRHFHALRHQSGYHVAIKELTMGLVTFHGTIPRASAVVLHAHMFLVSVLLAYFPFSKLMHLGGVFLSPTRNMTGNTATGSAREPLELSGQGSHLRRV
jgi:nitrate reductase gamma subunit